VILGPIRIFADDCGGNIVQESGAAPQFAQLLVEGKISNETSEEWNRETGSKKLPERAKPKSASSTKKATGKSTGKSAAPSKGRKR
jgi:hypothetical protein